MDYNNNEHNVENTPTSNHNYYNNNQPSAMATAALVLGILSIVSICCFYGSYIVGGLAITFALLSRGKDRRFSTNALVGLILSIVGIVVSTVVIVFFTITTILSYGSLNSFIQEYDTFYENIYGEESPFKLTPYNDGYDNNVPSYDFDLPDTLTITLD